MHVDVNRSFQKCSKAMISFGFLSWIVLESFPVKTSKSASASSSNDFSACLLTFIIGCPLPAKSNSGIKRLSRANSMICDTDANKIARNSWLTTCVGRERLTKRLYDTNILFCNCLAE